MEVYTTENEQVDALRRFFAENGKALAVGVVLGIGAPLAGVTGRAMKTQHDGCVAILSGSQRSSGGRQAG